MKPRVFTSVRHSHVSDYFAPPSHPDSKESSPRRRSSPDHAATSSPIIAEPRSHPSSFGADGSKKRTPTDSSSPKERRKRLFTSKKSSIHRRVADDSDWLIEKVLAHKTVQMANRSIRQYCIKWSGRPDIENTWESEEGLEGADVALKDYRASAALRSMRAKTRPPNLPIVFDLEESES